MRRKHKRSQRQAQQRAIGEESQIAAYDLRRFSPGGTAVPQRARLLRFCHFIEHGQGVGVIHLYVGCCFPVQEK